jgi:hypothetical protein
MAGGQLCLNIEYVLRQENNTESNYLLILLHLITIKYQCVNAIVIEVLTP